jgi:hypothetical protein
MLEPPAPGTPVDDLRFGFCPTPEPFPGYDPAGDALAVATPGIAAALAPIPGEIVTGSYAPNERFVIKVPHVWNGSLVVAGTPAMRSEFANDLIWGDFALSRGYAFACSNKGLRYNVVLETLESCPKLSIAYPIPFDLLGLETNRLVARIGALDQPTSIADWNEDFARLTRTAQAYLGSYRRLPARTYAVGTSNGGAQVRSLLERHGELVDGGVEWEGVYWDKRATLLDALPAFLTHMPAYVESAFRDAQAAAAIVTAGFPADAVQDDPAHPSLWLEYYSNQPSFYCDVTLFAYALQIDPEAHSRLGPGGCTPNPRDPLRLPGDCDGSGLARAGERAAYTLSPAGRARISEWRHTGAIEKPLVSIAGTHDILIPPALNAVPYLEAVVAAGRAHLYRQYIVRGGTHLDSFAAFGYGLQPQLPFAWAAFDQLVATVERGFQAEGEGLTIVVDSSTQIPR